MTATSAVLPISPRSRRSARTRQAILDAALRIVTTSGAGALSMRAIAEAIDYSPAGLYEYFGGKDEILRGLCEDGFDRLAASLGRVDGRLPVDERVQALGLAYLDFAWTHPEHYRLIFGSGLFGAINPGEEPHGTYRVLREAVQDGIDSGAFIVRPGFGMEAMSYACWALLHGLVMLRLGMMAGHDAAALATADREAIRSFIRGLGSD